MSVHVQLQHQAGLFLTPLGLLSLGWLSKSFCTGVSNVQNCLQISSWIRDTFSVSNGLVNRYLAVLILVNSAGLQVSGAQVSGAQVSVAQATANQDPFADRPIEATTEDADVLYATGQYEAATKVALANDEANQRYDADEGWLLLAIRSQLAVGNAQRALEIHQAALEKFPQSIRHRWLGIDVCRFNDDQVNAKRMMLEIESLVRRAPWRYRDIENQFVLAEFLLSQQVDAKEILTKVLNPIKEQNPRLTAVYLVIGKLALSKSDFAMAAENFAKAIELDRNNPDAFYGLAQAFKPSDWGQSRDALQNALSINDKHADSLLMMADQLISGEKYSEATDLLDDVLSSNPTHPIAWAYKAVLAHLHNEHEQEADARTKALSTWSGNPEVDFVIGRELSEKYRFLEGSQYQRRALVYETSYKPAKMQLAHDLLRLGQELEGWKLAEEVFDADQYSVIAHNLLTLRDNLSQFTTLEQNGLLVRMDRLEAALYGQQVLQLLSEAEETLTQKYNTQLQKPVFIEIFPRQQDFAIRTFGLPGGDGYLGVCFGRLITMNSPAAQGSGLTSWRSVLWHEFCHVVTLQKTQNKMPRWLSEGISVYEESLKDPAWGQTINPTFQNFLLGEELTPVSQLSAAFLSPKSSLHVQFAYFESALVVRYLNEKFGNESVLAVLDELSNGMDINDALSRHAAPIDFIDRDFKKYATDLAKSFAPDASFAMPEENLPQNLEQWQAFVAENPNNVPGLMFQAKLLFEQGQFPVVKDLAKKVIALAPDVSNEARLLLAKCYRNEEDFDSEYQVLKDLSARDSDSVEVLTRLLEITSQREDWRQTEFYADRLLALNPLLREPHQYLSEVADATDNLSLAAVSLSALAELEPVDPADIHFRLAASLEKLGRFSEAKRHVLLAMEQAPRYREAHALLLRLVARETKSHAEKNDSLNEPLAIPKFDQPPQPNLNRNQSNRTTAGERR